MSELIEAKVAQILNDRELVINRGSDDGVAMEMKFKILETSDVIVDPDTREELGRINREKVRVKVNHVETRLSIGRTYQIYRERVVNPQSFDMSRLFYVTKVRTLGASASFEHKDALVEIGDRLVQVAEGEE